MATEHVERYLEVFESLRQRKKWSTGNEVLRFAALTLTASDVAGSEVDLEAAARELADAAGAFSPLSSAVRYAIAAILIRRGFKPSTVARSTKETLALFKQHKLNRGTMQATLAALLLVLDAGGSCPRPETVARLRAILERWKQDHRWLTGNDDYPMAAMHATRDVSVESLGLEVEQIYQSLASARFRKGEQLQLATHILACSDIGPHAAAGRFAAVARQLRERGERIWTTIYDEIAMLAVSGIPEGDAAERVLVYRDRLRQVKPKPTAAMAFSIAAGAVLGEEADRVEGLEETAEVAGLHSVQAMIAAQQAAMVASIAAVTVVATSGS
jgi:hypothetical protein